MMGEWHDISTAPRDGTEILAWGYGQDISIIAFLGDRENNKEWHCMADGYRAIQSQGDFGTEYRTFWPTHWMHLPAPPQANEGHS